MSVIDSGKIIEVLFDNSEKYPENVYLDIMNMMKRHHEFGDNEPQIIEYLQKVDPSLILKFNIYKQKLSKYNFSHIYLVCKVCIAIFFLFSFAGVIIYVIVSTSPYYTIQRISNHTG